MTTPLANHQVSTFEVPALPPLSALRDRAEEAAERSMRLREDGYADGYQAGLDAAATQIEQQIAEHRLAADRLTAAATAFEAAARDLNRRDAATLAEFEEQALAIGMSIATELVARELRAAEQPVLDAIRRAIAVMPERGTPVVRVHPDDLATADDAAEAGLLAWDAGTTITADPAVERGGCIVDVGDCRIDAQLGPALDRMRTAARS